MAATEHIALTMGEPNQTEPEMELVYRLRRPYRNLIRLARAEKVKKAQARKASKILAKGGNR